MTTHLAIQPLTIILSLVNRCLACRPDHLTVAVKGVQNVTGFFMVQDYKTIITILINLRHELNQKGEINEVTYP